MAGFVDTPALWQRFSTGERLSRPCAGSAAWLCSGCAGYAGAIGLRGRMDAIHSRGAGWVRYCGMGRATARQQRQLGYVWHLVFWFHTVGYSGFAAARAQGYSARADLE